ncbi:hypothetical protein Tco_1322925 [Tanacetum coccineum]
MAEPILNENMEKAQTESNLSITSNDIKIELNKEFLVELRKNIYHGTYNEDMVFLLSLADDAKEWWNREGDGKITTWEELVEKFFCRFYPESYDGEDKMLDERDNWGIDPLDFLSNVSTSFKSHKKVDEITQKDLVKDISTNIGGEFTNLEILKCWSLETSRRLFNTNSG